MKKTTKLLSSLLVFCLLSTLMVPCTNAAPPRVTTDETVYVNLDFYGVLSDIRIVKGNNLNGNTEFTDYGVYDSVTNMTSHVQPVLTDDSVSWKLDNSVRRFYYECKPKDNSIKLPWTFDISYKLNGIPKKAEELAGASGLVEINVEAIPNAVAPEYYKNNMLLQMTTLIKTEDTSSVDAPGAQLQSIGAYKAIVFAALPGEHMTFTMRIGTDRFETPGIAMMMIPGTLDQLKKIKELKEAKDTVQDSTNAIYTSLNDILGTLESMADGLKTFQSGLYGLDDTHSSISSFSEGVYQNADVALSDVTDLTGQIVELIPHLQNGQQMVENVNADVNTIVQTVTGAKEHLAALTTSTSKIQRNIVAFRDMLSDFNTKAEDRNRVKDNLNDALEDLQNNLEALRDDMLSMRISSSNLSAATSNLTMNTESVKGISGSLKNMMYTLLGVLVPETVDQSVYVGQQQMLLGALAPDIAAIDTEMDLILSRTDNAINKLTAFLDQTVVTLHILQRVCDNGQELADSLNDALNLTDEYFNILENHNEDADLLLKEMYTIGDTAKKSLDLSTTLINDTIALNNTLNTYKDDIVTLLKDGEELTSLTSRSLTSTTEFLKSFKNMLKASDKTADNGTQETLKGLIEILKQSLNGIEKTSTLRNANDTIKTTIDGEFDKYEDENKFLHLDTEKKMVSFTSDRNPTPESIQVILRTEEISLDTVDDSKSDLEKATTDTSVWARIEKIFKKIWGTLTLIFAIK